MLRLLLAFLGLAVLSTSIGFASPNAGFRTEIEPLRSTQSSLGAVEIRLADLGNRVDA